MKLTKFAVATIAALTITGAASAQDSNTYGAIGVTSYDFDYYGLDGKVGYNFTENFGVEGQGVLGLTSKTEAGVDVKVDYTIGAFATARMPLNDQFDVFVRAGYHSTSVSAEANGISASTTASGYALGGGAQFNLDATNGIRAEYTVLDDNGGLDTFTVSYVRNF